jgi:hypothetical protein
VKVVIGPRNKVSYDTMRYDVTSSLFSLVITLSRVSRIHRPDVVI